MNVLKITEQDAFNEGADLWIISNDPKLPWWEKLDFHSRQLLTKTYLHEKTNPPSELIDIVKATSLNQPEKIKLKNYVLLGTADHFLNKWILVYTQMPAAELADTLDDLTKKLNFTSLRFFSDSQKCIDAIKARPTASSLSISYIENT
jgi:hypothetical protein